MISSLKIPIDSRIASKFKMLKTKSSEVLGNSRAAGQSRLHDMNDRAMGFTNLGSNVNPIVDQVNSIESIDGLTAASTSLQTAIASADAEPIESVPLSDYEFHSSHSFIQEYLKSLPSGGDDTLKTSIKNYGDSLNSGNLRSFTEKVIQENKEDKDFEDWSFQRFTHQSKAPEVSIDFRSFQEYLLNQGFKPQQLEFLDGELTNEEIELKLNEIMDQNRREQRIKIIGENLSMRLSPPFMALVLLMII
ncbi:hypothetical protein CLIB1444_03S01948 [[Candida] jaroonii]|uniref:Uncharacterized protein n=1 Tax=[Candida] jaroonii TaxID=467808 RepID=A0ACA9Y5Q8_9ASCO|nr:hypothetical protein CLIB1444_03S01948 [[Candida] jaroonii]